MSRLVPGDMASETGFTALRLDMDEALQYLRVRDTLTTDPLLEHLSRDEVERDLWRLVCQISLMGGLKDQRRRRQQARVWLESVRRPWVEYEFVQEIGGLESGVDGLRFDGAEFRCLTPTFLRQWQLEGRVRWKGRVGVVVMVHGGSVEKAVQRGKTFATLLRNVLRFGLDNTIRIPLTDDQLSFPMGWYAIRPTAALRWSRYSVDASSPSGARWRNGDIGRALELVRPFESLDRSTHTRIREQFETAFRWLGSIRESDEAPTSHVFASSAIESLLGSRDESSKGELLAVRAMLLGITLGEGFVDPLEVVRWYGVRSDLVHGERFEEEKTSRGDRWVWDVSRVTRQVLSLCAAAPAIRSRRALFRHIETEDAFDRAAEWLQHRGARYAGIAEAVERRRVARRPEAAQ